MHHPKWDQIKHLHKFEDLTKAERKILAYFLYIRNEATGLCCPSDRKAAKTIGISYSQFKRVKQSLRSKQYIYWTTTSRGSHKTTQYTLIFAPIIGAPTEYWRTAKTKHTWSDYVDPSTNTPTDPQRDQP